MISEDYSYGRKTEWIIDNLNWLFAMSMFALICMLIFGFPTETLDFANSFAEWGKAIKNGSKWYSEHNRILNHAT